MVRPTILGLFWSNERVSDMLAIKVTAKAAMLAVTSAFVLVTASGANAGNADKIIPAVPGSIVKRV
jgi:hypothetical protein